MQEIFEAIKKSAVRIKHSIESDDSGYSQNKNATGDVQLKLDIKSDLIIEEEFSKISSIKEIASEEKEQTQSINADGKYLIAYDPLDGSSLVDVNLSVGSIFGIYEDNYNGLNMKASAYVVYGPRVELVIATKEDVKLYRMDTEHTFYFVRTIRLNDKGKIQSPGATQKNWFKYHKELIDSIFQEGYRLRYSGGMVPDLHQILLKGGGMFSYPGTTDKPKGKLRMTFEVFPFAFVFEQAGGFAINGTERLLDLIPEHIHDTTPCFFGSKYEIKKVSEIYERYR